MWFTIWSLLIVFLCISFFSQFNCSYRKTEEIPKPKPGGALFPPRPPVNDISFKMELSNSLSFNNPVHQGFFVVSDQQQVFVQVTPECFTFISHSYLAVYFILFFY